VAPDPAGPYPHVRHARMALHDDQEVRVRPTQQGDPGVALGTGRQARHGPRRPRHRPRVHGPDLRRAGQLLPVRDEPARVPPGARVRVREVGAGAARVRGGAVPGEPRRTGASCGTATATCTRTWTRSRRSWSRAWPRL
jgi:hypothetical protein